MIQKLNRRKLKSIDNHCEDENVKEKTKLRMIQKLKKRKPKLIIIVKKKM